MSVYVRLTAAMWPTVFEAMETISHDGGGRAGWDWYDIPVEWTPIALGRIETGLEALSEDELMRFSIPADDEDDEIIAAYPAVAAELKTAKAFLHAFFDADWRRGREGGGS